MQCQWPLCICMSSDVFSATLLLDCCESFETRQLSFHTAQCLLYQLQCEARQADAAWQSFTNAVVAHAPYSNAHAFFRQPASCGAFQPATNHVEPVRAFSCASRAKRPCIVALSRCVEPSVKSDYAQPVTSTLKLYCVPIEYRLGCYCLSISSRPSFGTPGCLQIVPIAGYMAEVTST